MKISRYEAANISNQIDGYLIPRPGEGYDDAWDRAKAELIEKLERHLHMVKGFSKSDFQKSRAKRVSA